VKRTFGDDVYAERFAERLEKAYSAAKLRGIADEAFAASIGVKRPALKKYLRGGAVPSLLTLALAKRNHGINVPYEGVDLGGLVPRVRNKRKPTGAAIQLRLPFSIQVSRPAELEVELKKLKTSKYELRIRTRRVG
jgi:transcriptional regulator with XRE-family HTH domain